MLTRILWSRVLKIFVPPSFVQREQSVDRNIFINIRQCLSRYSYGKRSFNLKFNLNFDLHSHRFPIASSIELRVSFIIVLLSRPAISIVFLISYHWILDPSRDLARKRKNTEEQKCDARDRPAVQDKVGGQRVNRMQRPVSIWCEWYPWEMVPRNRLHQSRLPLAIRTSTWVGRYVEVGRSNDRARETSAFSGNRNIRCIVECSSVVPHPVISHDTEAR